MYRPAVRAVVISGGEDADGHIELAGDARLSDVSYPSVLGTLRVTGQERTVRHDIKFRHPQADPGLT